MPVPFSSRTQTVTASYSGQSPFVLNYGYDAGSRVTSITDGDGVSVTMSYSQRNQVSQLAWQGMGIAASVKFAHDPLGDLTDVKRYADTSVTSLIGQTSYSYSRNLPNIGYQAAAFNAGGDQTQTSSFAQSEAYGPLQNNRQPIGLLTAGTQALSRLGGVAHKDSNGNTLASEGYTNDAAGQLSTKALGLDTVTYGHDAGGQLTVASHSSNTTLNESYSYDAAGNRTKTGAQTVANTIAAGNRITADNQYSLDDSYSYDDEGNVITRTDTTTGKKWTYSYDLRNRMTQAVQSDSGNNVLSQIDFKYDVFDRRIAKTVNGAPTQFFYEGDKIWKRAFSGNITRYLTDGSVDQWIARSDASGVSWYLADRLGSITGITNSAGTLTNSTTYDSYGHILSQSNPALADSLGFSGREFDSETSLYYFRARYYNPDLGRFQSEDQAGSRQLTNRIAARSKIIPFASGSYNLFGYVDNNPLNSKDLLGLAPNGRGMSSEYYIVLSATSGSRVATLAVFSRAILFAEDRMVLSQLITLDSGIFSSDALFALSQEELVLDKITEMAIFFDTDTVMLLFFGL